MILLINTAKTKSFIGLAENGKIIKKKIWEADLRQSEELLSKIEKLVGKRKVGGIVAVIGPGSFTGLRVGVATANALGYGWGVGVVGVDRFLVQSSKFKVQSYSSKLRVKNSKLYVIVLENIRGMVWAGLVQSSKFKVQSFSSKSKVYKVEKFIKLESKDRVQYFAGGVEELCDKIKESCYLVGEVDKKKEEIFRRKLGDKILGIKKLSDFDEDVLENLVMIGEERLKKVKKGQIVLPFYIRPAHITKAKS